MKRDNGERLSRDGLLMTGIANYFVGYCLGDNDNDNNNTNCSCSYSFNNDSNNIN